MADGENQRLGTYVETSAGGERVRASPIVTIQTVSEKLAVSFPTASTALENLAKIGVVRETTGRQRGRIYAYSDYLALLDRGTDPLPA